MVIPEAAIDMAKRFEGFHRVPNHDPHRAYPYLCPAGFWTIGYGHLCDPNHSPIGEEEAEDYLAQDRKPPANPPCFSGRGIWQPAMRQQFADPTVGLSR